jgi:hypothetical protein
VSATSGPMPEPVPDRLRRNPTYGTAVPAKLYGFPYIFGGPGSPMPRTGGNADFSRSSGRGTGKPQSFCVALDPGTRVPSGTPARPEGQGEVKRETFCVLRLTLTAA